MEIHGKVDRTTNTIESLNNSSVFCQSRNLRVEIEQNYKEDVKFCHIVLGKEYGVYYSYRENWEESEDEPEVRSPPIKKKNAKEKVQSKQKTTPKRKESKRKKYQLISPTVSQESSV